MGRQNHDLVVRFIGDTGSLGKSMDTLQGRFSGLQSSIATVAKAGAAVGAVAWFKGAIDAASDLSETTSKVGVVFGKVAPQIQQFAATSTKALGQSKQAAMDAAATFATFGKGAGLSGDKLANFSTQMVTLASDMASFSNTSPEEAIEAIGAALRGENDPIEKYGVLLNEATIKQSALRLGLIKTTSEALTPQQKVLAAQAAILAQTSDAQGDFSRTSDGLANQQRILAAEWENTTAQLGERFLPVAKSVVGWMNNSMLPAVGHVADEVGDVAVPALKFLFEAGKSVTSMFAGLPGPIQAGAIALVAWRLVGDRIGGTAGSMRDSLKGFGEEVKLQQSLANMSGESIGRFGATLGALESRVPAVAAVGTAFRGARGEAEGFGGVLRGSVAGAFAGVKVGAAGLMSLLGGPWGVAITAASIGLGIFASQNAKAEARQKDLAAAGQRVAQSLRDQNGIINENVRRSAAKEAEEKGLLKAAKELGVELPTVTDAILGQGTAYDDLKAKLTGAVEANRKFNEGSKIVDAPALTAQGQHYQDVLNTLNGLVAGKNADVEATKRQDAATASTTGTQAGLATAQSAAVTSSDMLKAAVEGLGGKFDETKTFGQNLSDVIKGLTQNQQDAIDLEENYEAALDSLTESVKTNGTTLDIHTVKGRANRDSLEAAAESIRNMTQADLDSGVPAQEAIKKHDERAAALEREATKLGLSKTEAEKLITTYSQIPANVRTIISTQGAEEVQAKLDRLSATQALLETGLAATPANVKMMINERQSRFATGGLITGPGGPTSDQVPIWASNREFMQPADTVSYYGVGFMEALRRKQIPRMAEGGLINWPFPVDVSKTKIPDTSLYSGGASLASLQRFAMDQRGKPYQWGATGPASWDCSGLVGAIWAMAHGMSPYGRYMTTAGMGVGRYGMKAGPGKVTVYLGPGHTAANIGGLHAEAYGGNGTPVAVGRIGTPLSYYDTVMHMARGGLVNLRNKDVRRQSFMETGWPEPSGFKNGGWLKPGRLAYNETSQPEAVFNKKQLGEMGGTHHHHYTVNINAPVGSQRELESWFVKIRDKTERGGRY